MDFIQAVDPDPHGSLLDQIRFQEGKIERKNPEKIRKNCKKKKQYIFLKFY